MVQTRNAISVSAMYEKEFNWQPFVIFWNSLRIRFRLLKFVLVAAAIFSIAIYCISMPYFTAVAVIGPPRPSPTDQFLSNTSNASATASLTKRLFGGAGSSSSSDNFGEYVQLLHSVRLARVLVENNHLLQVLYPARWDGKNARWLPPSKLESTVRGFLQSVGFVKNESHQHPDVDDAVKYLRSNVMIETSSGFLPANVSPLLAGSSYPTVTLRGRTPREAEQLLTTILLVADNIIRNDLRQNVASRMSFLRAEAQKTFQSDQRDALISVLSGQQQLKMMVEADTRFASTLIDPPYASDSATSHGLVFYFVLAVVGALAFWIILCQLARKFVVIDRLLVILGC